MAVEKDKSVPLFTRTERIVVWLVGALILLGLAILLLWHTAFVRIPAGSVGVRYLLLGGGTVTDTVLHEGIQAKVPWDNIYRYEVRLQKMQFDVIALSVEGMNVRMTGAILFHPLINQTGLLHKTIGPQYRERAVLPITLAAVREVTAQYASQELYSIDYDNLKSEVLTEVRKHETADLLNYVDLAITQVLLPQEISAAIEEKLTQEQLAAAYQFRLLREEQEAERKRIEAIGIRAFYGIVNEALTEGLLTWRGIEATVQLAQSPNTKIVIVGSGEDQLPLILGSDITKAPSEPQALTDATLPTDNQLPTFSTLTPLFPSLPDKLNTTGTQLEAVGQTGVGEPSEPTILPER